MPPILDFKEIPEAHLATGLQDSFEFFARDFLEFLGYQVELGPARGSDGGVDLIVSEKGLSGNVIIRWLVSCKHKAHSGNSVSDKEEINHHARIRKHKCDGFMGFYSTLPSSTLNETLIGLRGDFLTSCFDAGKIEERLFSSEQGIKLAERYFPKSIAKWREQSAKQSKSKSERKSLYCQLDGCRKNLLFPEPNGIVIIWRERKVNENTYRKNRVKDIHWCCEGDCDRKLSHLLKNRYRDVEDLPDERFDIDALLYPGIRNKWTALLLNRNLLTDVAESKLIELLDVLSDNAPSQTIPEEIEKGMKRLSELTDIWQHSSLQVTPAQDS